MLPKTFLLANTSRKIIIVRKFMVQILSFVCRMLDVHGKLISVGLPDTNLPEMAPFSLVSNGCFLGGSKIGSKKEALQMLDIAAKKHVKPW